MFSVIIKKKVFYCMKNSRRGSWRKKNGSGANVYYFLSPSSISNFVALFCHKFDHGPFSAVLCTIWSLQASPFAWSTLECLFFADSPFLLDPLVLLLEPPALLCYHLKVGKCFLLHRILDPFSSKSRSPPTAYVVPCITAKLLVLYCSHLLCCFFAVWIEHNAISDTLWSITNCNFSPCIFLSLKQTWPLKQYRLLLTIGRRWQLIDLTGHKTRAAILQPIACFLLSFMRSLMLVEIFETVSPHLIWRIEQEQLQFCPRSLRWYKRLFRLSLWVFL